MTVKSVLLHLFANIECTEIVLVLQFSEITSPKNPNQNKASLFAMFCICVVFYFLKIAPDLLDGLA